MGANKATRINPFIVNGKTVDIHITVRGSDWYWAVMSIMGTTLLVILGVSLLRPRTHRVFHHILAIVAVVATVMSFSLASNLGWTPIDVEWHRSDPKVAGINRQIWWVRYCGWFIIWPLLTLSLCLTAVMPLANTVWSCFLSAAMAVLALVGAMVRSDYKWGYYTFWCACWFALLFNLLFSARRHARSLGNDVGFAFLATSSWFLFLWMLYPICWGISEGGNIIPPDSEFVFYGVLDCCLIPLGSAILLWSHWKIDPKRLGLYMRDYNDPIPGVSAAIHDEKTSRAADVAGDHPETTTGVTNGATANPPTASPTV